MRILITGAFGNLGAWMVEVFAKAGHHIGAAGRAVDMPPYFQSYWQDCGYSVESILMDILDEQQLSSGLEKGWDAVVHLASMNDNFMPGYPRMAIEANSWGTRMLVEAWSKHCPNGHFIYFSTFHVYGRSTGLLTEETPVAPVHDYATTHYFAEQYIRQFARTHNTRFSIIRLTNSYGAPADPHTTKWYLVLNDLSKMAFSEKKIALNGNGQAVRDFVWMGTVVEAIRLLAENGAENELYHISSGKTIRLIEVAERVQAAYQERYGEVLPININSSDTTQADLSLQVSHEKLVKRFATLRPLLQGNFMKEEAIRIFELLERQAK